MLVLFIFYQANVVFLHYMKKEIPIRVGFNLSPMRALRVDGYAYAIEASIA